MSLASLLANSAREHPTRPAISVGTRPVLEYASLAREAAGIAAELSRRGLGPGDRVLLAMKNNESYFSWLFGCWWGGFIAVPINATLHGREIAEIVADIEPRVAVADAAIAAELSLFCPDLEIIERGGAEARRAARAEPVHGPSPVALDETAWVFYTSGTTGTPKGACLSHANLLAMATGYLADVDRLTPRDSLLHLAATSHASGLFGLSFVARAAEHVLMPSGGYDPDEMRSVLRAREAVTFFAPTTLLNRMCRDGIGELAENHIRTVLTGAGPVLSQDVRDAVETFGPRLWNGYGQGESPCTITANDQVSIARAIAEGDEVGLVSVGVPRTGVTLKLLAPDGSEVSPGETGEVCLRAPTVMTGYLNRPEATAETLAHGWLHTGDVGRIDECGRLYLLDRLKDVIISGGMNVYAREVEDVLSTHPSIGEVAVIGQADPEWGEIVVALIVPRPGADTRSIPESLDQLCLDRLARFKRPKRYEIRKNLPRNAAGKVLKSKLRN